MLYQLSYLGVFDVGSVYQKNRLWSVSWVENGERRYSHGYPTKDMAEKVRANIALDLAAGRGGLKRPKDAKPLRGLAEAWLEAQRRPERAQIYVRESVDGPTEDKDARVVPIVDGLAQVLTAWREQNGPTSSYRH